MNENDKTINDLRWMQINICGFYCYFYSSASFYFEYFAGMNRFWALFDSIQIHRWKIGQRIVCHQIWFRLQRSLYGFLLFCVLRLEALDDDRLTTIHSAPADLYISTLGSAHMLSMEHAKSLFVCVFYHLCGSRSIEAFRFYECAHVQHRRRSRIHETAVRGCLSALSAIIVSSNNRLAGWCLNVDGLRFIFLWQRRHHAISSSRPFWTSILQLTTPKADAHHPFHAPTHSHTSNCAHAWVFSTCARALDDKWLWATMCIDQ